MFDGDRSTNRCLNVTRVNELSLTAISDIFSRLSGVSIVTPKGQKGSGCGGMLGLINPS